MTDPPFIRSIRVMRRIDQYLGPPICLALGIVNAWAQRLRPPRRAVTETGIRKALVIKFWGMGSIVLATPALRALKRAHPDCRVTFLTFEQNEPVCKMIKSIDHVRGYRATDPATFVASFADLVRFLRRERFDAVIDLEFFANFTSIITAMSGAPITVGFHTPKVWRERFYSRRVSFDHSRHIAEIFLKAVQTVGAAADGHHIEELVVEGTAAAPLEQLLGAHSVTATDQLICVNVNASPLDYKRRWPLEHYRELIGRIRGGFPAHRVILVGAREEAPYVAQLMGSLEPSPHIIDLCGRLGLEPLVLLLQRSQLFIGNDSGPLHLAAAARTPTVSFFGPETPALYGPRGSADAVLYKNVPCSPCLNAYYSKDNSSCRNNVCMTRIEVEEAWAAVCAHLAPPADTWSAREARSGR